MNSIDKLIASQKPGFALDQRFYTDPDIYKLEIDRIVTRNWILAGHQTELPEPGDFKVFNVAKESAITRLLRRTLCWVLHSRYLLCLLVCVSGKKR